MKNTIIAFLISVLTVSTAKSASMFDGMTQEQLAEYEITVTNKKTGKTVGKMSRAEYKVVKIGSGEEATEIPEIAANVSRIREVIQAQGPIATKYREGYNTLIVHAGLGKGGLDYAGDGNIYQVSEKNAAVFGATGCRSWSGKGLCGSAFTNKTFTLGLKFDF